MNGKLLLITCLVIALILPNGDGWFFRRRRRRRRPVPTPPVTPPPVPSFPPISAECQALYRRYTMLIKDNTDLFDLARQWAPLVHLAEGEEYKPSSVEFFLKHVNVIGGPNPQPLTPQNLPRCNSNCFLTSKEPLGCASCTRPSFLRGEKHAPVYATIKVSENVVQITYRFFYPYNRGKRVCVGLHANNICPCGKVFGHCLCPRINGCIGKYSTFGNHVGDWEHVKVRFENNMLHSMFLSTHNSDVTNKFAGTFKWNGRTFQKGNKKLQMSLCTHGVVYSTKGSHGLWPSVGRNVYMNLPNGDKLVDYTSNGDAWNTWKNLKITMEKPQGQYTGEFNFMNFEGRWGNRKESCGFKGMIEKLVGECVLNSGPRRSV